MRRTDTASFLEKLLKRFPENNKKYDYSLCVVDGMDSRISYKCLTCGHVVTDQCASDHYHGYGCPSCAGNLRYTKEILISKSIEKFGDKFDFSVTEDFIGKSTKIKIGCPIHNEVETTPLLHLKSVSGCPLCYRYGAEEIKELFYKNPYNSKSTLPYLDEELKGKIKLRYLTVHCPSHGEYKVVLTSVVAGTGCQRCTRERSTGIYTRSVANKNKTTLLNRKSGVYLFKLTSSEIDCYKIGISNNIKRRTKELARHSKCDVTLLYYGEVDEYTAIQLEQDVLDDIKDSRYVSPYTFRGCTELLKLSDEAISNLIEYLATVTKEHYD